MPYKLISHSDGTYSVKSMDSGKLVSKKTTLKNALAQIRLLQAIEQGFRPTGRR